MADLLLPVVGKRGPEKAEARFRIFTIDLLAKPLQIWIIALGYLAAIFAKVCHPSHPAFENIAERRSQIGVGHFDCTAEMPRYQISHVEFHVTSYPDGADLVFGDPPLIYAGKCAFFFSTDANQAFDWGIITPVRTVQSTLSISINTPPPPAIPPQEYGFLAGGFSGLVKVPYTGALAHEVNNAPAPISFTGTATFKLGGQGRPKPAIQRLVGTVMNNIRHFLPLHWINYERSVFYADHPNATGIWWHLKEGVVADVRIYGTETDPGAEGTDVGEAGSYSYEFNPMQGGNDL